MGNFRVCFLTALALLASACGPAAPSVAPQSQAPAATSPDDTRTLVFATRNEPVYISKRGLQSTAPGSTGPVLFDAGLTMTAGQGTPTELQLAEAFPQLDTDTWKVLPEGRMETTWRLRPNLKWHDGTPLTADDFVFGFQVYRLPQFDGARLAGGFIDDVTAPDPRTVVIHWKGPYPTAAEDDGTVPALPRHILGAPFERLDSEAFAALPYWTSEYVGLGPYRMDKREPGSFIEGVAFDDYVFGRPKISRLKLIWIADSNTLVANVLSGGVQYVDSTALEFEQALVLKRQWTASGEGTIAYNPVKIRYVQIQYKAEVASPPAVQDLRVRQALAHAIDKQSLVDAMIDGEPGIANTFLSPLSPYYGELDKVLTKYPLDLRRTDQLMTDAGFRKDGEGFYSKDGLRFAPELAAFSGQGEKEALLIHDSWKRAGIDTPLRTITPAQQRDLELVSTYPAFRIEQTNADQPGVHHATSGCARAERAWVGSNRGCFSDPEYDRLWSTFLTALDSRERSNAHIQAMKLLSDKVAGMPLYYGYLITGFPSSLVGPKYGYTDIQTWRYK
ncbi:MAG: peptide/nickel transport system substrate-binding protein [Chloroflexota bacterium]|jgi:peptide/nickel transport system substrate-binding protein|nr:peptide/nickel transport system substrate-binding protein [Chloroflexota bacterium]